MHLWAKKHNKYQNVVSEFDQHLIDQGYKIEELAIRFLKTKIENSTKKLITQQTYTDGNFEARVDVLLYDEVDDSFDLYEIKSSTSQQDQELRKNKDEHLYDATFQALILEKNIILKHTHLVTVNKEYVRQRELDLSQFFLITQIDQSVVSLHNLVKELRNQAFETCKLKIPENIEACVNPRTCPCKELCHPILPDYSIYDINGLFGKTKKELRSKGILTIKEIPKTFPLPAKQRVQVDVTQSGSPLIHIDAIRHEIEQLTSPLCFLDYETFNPGIPLYDRYHPYQHMVFQYSLNVIEDPEKKPKHFEYLIDHKGDPGPEICSQLQKDLPKAGTIVVWNKTFESGCNKDMAEMYPEFRKFLLEMNERIYDLGDPFKYNNMYVLPEFKGSWSIKNILPVLIPELSYDELVIGEGATAMNSWWKMVYEHTSEERKTQIKTELLKYCELDTHAMFVIWRKLKSLI